MNINNWKSAPNWDSLLFEDMAGFIDYDDYTPVYSYAVGPRTTVANPRQPATGTPTGFPTVSPGTGAFGTTGTGASPSTITPSPSGGTAATTTTSGTIQQATGGGRQVSRPTPLPTSVVRGDILPRLEAAVQTIQTRAATPTAPPVTVIAPVVEPVVAAPMRLGGGGGGGGVGGAEEPKNEQPVEVQEQAKKKSPPIANVLLAGAAIVGVLYYLNK